MKTGNVKQKARIQLLDEVTGLPIVEVDALTSSETILYTNPNPILNDIGSLKAGTTFNETGLDVILDNLLYRYTTPNIISVECDNPDIPYFITKDKEISKSKGVSIDGFKYRVKFTAGSELAVTCYLKIYSEDQKVNINSSNFEVIPGNTYMAEFDIPSIDINSTIEISISDGKDTVYGPYIKYYFLDPVFVGFADPDLLTDGELKKENMAKIYDYFTGLIRNDRYKDQLQRRLCNTGTNQKQFAMNVDYDHRMNANPVLLIPEYWGNATFITDMHGNNIIKNFTILTDLNLKLYDDVNTISYTVYMCKQSFNVNSLLMNGITYGFTPYDCNVQDTEYNGIPITTGFDIEYYTPIDNRFVVDTYGDLLQIRFPYKGLITYVKDIKTLFKYDEHWLPTSTRFLAVENKSVLTSDIGGWDDVAIDTSTGDIYRKRYNNVWELWGTIKGSGGSSGNVKEWIFHESYDSNYVYRNTDSFVDIVYYEGSSYYCKGKEVTGIEPFADGVNWAYLCKGYDGNTRSKLRFYNLETGEIIDSSKVRTEDLESGKVIALSEVKFVNKEDIK